MSEPDEHPAVSIELAGSRNLVITSAQQPTTLHCIASGTPAPEVTWTHNDKPVDKKHFIQLAGGSLFIRDTQLQDMGTYVVKAVNRVGKAEAAVRVEVKMPIPPERDPYHQPIKVEEFPQVIPSKKLDDEYAKVEGHFSFTNYATEMSINKHKNRYRLYRLYDHYRVVLSLQNSTAGSDYINASFINGYRCPNGYIASQGPLPSTFSDFWRMIWEYDCHTIVMVTKLKQGNWVLCDQYWPSKGTIKYGSIQVTVKEMDNLDAYSVRTFSVTSLAPHNRGHMLVHQFHFTMDWPVQGMPKSIANLLHFRNRVRKEHSGSKGPMVVHCSAGVGRAGVFIAIDCMMKQIEAEGTVDIFNFVRHMRFRRPLMVETESQYELIYDILLEAITTNVISGLYQVSDALRRQQVHERIINERFKIFICVLIINYLGLPRSGKTSLVRRVMGEIENIKEAQEKGETEQPSTGVADDLKQLVGVVQSKVWRVLKEGDEENLLNNFFHQVITTANLPAVGPKSNESSMAKVVEEPAVVPVSGDLEAPHSLASSKSMAVAAVTSSGKALSPTEALQTKNSKDEDMLSILKEAMDADNWDEVKDALEDTIFISNNDTGGHGEFVDLQAALIQGFSFNLLFSRLQDKLDDLFKIYYTNAEGASSEKEDSTVTLEESLFQALASIACFGGAFSDEVPPKDAIVGNLPAGIATSKVMFVGTHRDMVSQEEFEEKDQLLQQKIENTQFYKEGIIEYFSEDQLMIPVNNLSGDAKEIEMIQRIIMERIGKSLHQHKIEIPASWLVLSLYLRKKNFHTISLSRCEKIAGQLGIDAEELQDALWFLHHRVGVLLYYPEDKVKAMKDTVICQRKVVFESASNLIRNTFTVGKVSHTQVKMFKEKGEFSLKDLKEASSKQTDSLIPLDKLVELFEYLNILTRMQSSGSDPTYFMPCVLSSAKLAAPDHNHESRKSPAPLMVQYECGYVPLGIFPAMITHLVSQHQLGWKIIGKIRYKNKIRFHVGKFCDEVTFMSHPRFFEIAISPSKVSKTPLKELCANVLDVFKSTHSKVTSLMNHYFTMKYMISFDCPIADHHGREHLCIVREGTDVMLCQQDPEEEIPVAMEDHHKIWFSSPSPSATTSNVHTAQEGVYDSYVAALHHSHSPYLEKQLDWDSNGVDKDLSEIAEQMHDWEEKLAVSLGLTAIQISDIKTTYHDKPALQRRRVLQLWKTSKFNATYGNLLQQFVDAQHHQAALAVVTVLNKKSPAL